MMLTPSKDGAYIYIALEDDATGNQLVFKVTRPTTSTPTTVTAYEPAAGSSGNVEVTGDVDRMVFHGNFGSNVGVIDHAITALTNTDITPTTIGAEVIQPLSVNPIAQVVEILAWNEDDDDLLQTEDLGVSWTIVRSDGGLITSFGGMDVLWNGNFQSHDVYITGDGASGVKVYESLDGGITLTSLENSTLNTAVDSVGIVVAGV